MHNNVSGKSGHKNEFSFPNTSLRYSKKELAKLSQPHPTEADIEMARPNGKGKKVGTFEKQRIAFQKR